MKYLKFKQFICFIANIGKILIFHEYTNCLENEKGNIFKHELSNIKIVVYKNNHAYL